jgi:hypothetical protein
MAKRKHTCWVHPQKTPISPWDIGKRRGEEWPISDSKLTELLEGEISGVADVLTKNKHI